MRSLSLILATLILLSCNNSPYLLSDKNSDNEFIINYIKKLRHNGLINNNPSLVLNGELITYDSLKKCDLILYKKDIESIYAFFRKNDIGAKRLYGVAGKNGVILIKVKNHGMICN